MYRYAAEPFFFSHADNKDSPSIYSSMMKYFFIFSLLIFLGVSLYTDILQLLVGKDFREGLDVVPILLLANLFAGVFFNLSIWYKLTNKTWYGIYYTFAGAAITITLNIVLIPRIGYYGAAIARLFCYIAMCVLCYIGGKKFLQIPYDIKAMGIHFSVAIVLFILGYFVTIDQPILHFFYRLMLILSFIMFVIIYEKIPVLQTVKSFLKWK